jgi:polysaccharide export outer membrane protein
VAAETVGVETPLPRELWKESLPPYIIEPPDTLVIEAIRIVPLPPYRLEPLDVVLVQVAEALPNQPITGNYVVGPDGAINLGFSYGAVRVAGLTLEQAAAAIKNQLSRVLKAPQVGVALAQFRGMQQVRGEHLVTMDGTINLGSYGAVYVTGLTVPQAKAAIEKHLSRWLLNPEVAVTVSGYNSKVYYVITDGAGYGEQVFRFPITGNETVLDALSNINGIPPAGSKRYIWVARPAPPSKGCYQVLPVDWEVITQAGSTETNYQIFPGDRIYVQADKLIRIDNHLSKILAPIERLFGATLLGNFTVRSFERNRNGTGTTFFPF